MASNPPDIRAVIADQLKSFVGKGGYEAGSMATGGMSPMVAAGEPVVSPTGMAVPQKNNMKEDMGRYQQCRSNCMLYQGKAREACMKGCDQYL